MAKIFVGISGGVDSSTAALILKEAGHDVHGVYMKNWDCKKDEIRDAKKISKFLDIPLHIVSFEADYIENVFIPFLKGLDKGWTLNPDILCNKNIKFKLLLNYALNNGADYLATGHYVINNGNTISMGVDKSKDQSYFLYDIDFSILNKVLFPLGNMNKKDVRSLANKRGLFTGRKKDSMGICFIENGEFKNFITKFRPENKGEILHNGKIIGEHKGLHYYTLGQRKGLNIPNGPFYVVDKDVENNFLIVDKAGCEKTFFSKANILDKKGDYEGDCFARLSNLGVLHKVFVENNLVHFYSRVKKVGLGQSLVFYNEKGVVLGGGRLAGFPSN